MSNIRIKGAITSKKGVTLYLEDGSERNLRADSYQTQLIMDKIVKPLAQGKIAEIDLDGYSVERRIEERTNGVVRFFRRIKKVFTPSRDAGGVAYGDTLGLKSGEEIVAVVAGKEIAGMERLGRQMERAAYGKDAKGFQTFMERLAAVIDERGHSVDDLLNFMEKGDLPIADDGTIVAYKSLYDQGDHLVDPHTKKVTQKLGSFVAMDPKLIDPSRRTECSTGLHVGRRDYMRGFSGDTIMIIKVRPEDVIAVPHGERSKMRVAGYHIVARLSKEGRSLVMSNQPMTQDPKSAELLANVILGNHPGIKEHVVVCGPRGSNLKIVPVDDKTKHMTIKGIVERALDHGVSAISPREVRKAAAEARHEAAITGDMSAAISTPAAAPAVTEPLSKPEQKVIKKAAPAKSKTKVEPVAPPRIWETDEAVQKLTEKQREALRVMAEEGLSLRKTAVKLGMSHHTINRAQELLGLKQKHKG